MSRYPKGPVDDDDDDRMLSHVRPNFSFSSCADDSVLASARMVDKERLPGENEDEVSSTRDENGGTKVMDRPAVLIMGCVFCMAILLNGLIIGLNLRQRHRDTATSPSPSPGSQKEPSFSMMPTTTTTGAPTSGSVQISLTNDPTGSPSTNHQATSPTPLPSLSPTPHPELAPQTFDGGFGLVSDNSATAGFDFVSMTPTTGVPLSSSPTLARTPLLSLVPSPPSETEQLQSLNEGIFGVGVNDTSGATDGDSVSDETSNEGGNESFGVPPPPSGSGRPPS